MPDIDVGPAPQRALVIAHEPYGGAAEIESRLVERGIEVETHQVTSELDRPNDAAPFPSIDGYDIVVPMGSVRSLVTREGIDSWVGEEINLLRDAHTSGLAVLGVCFGGQLLAEALGGSVERAPVGEIGWYEIAAPDGMVNPVGSGPWMQWHNDRFEPPPNAQVLALTDQAVQLFRLARTVGTQFHPEVNLAHLGNWIRLSDDGFLEREGLDRDEMLAEAAANETANILRCHRLVDWFLDHVAQLPSLEAGSAAASSTVSASPVSRSAVSRSAVSRSAGSSVSDAEFMQ